jgi:hypothetical protein
MHSERYPHSVMTGAAIGLVAGAAYHGLARPRLLQWGASPEAGERS